MMWKSLVVMGMWAGALGLHSCNSAAQPANPSGNTSIDSIPKPMETVSEYTTRFNAWLAEANAPVQAGHDRAVANIGELSEGEEWGCAWEMDHREINAAARKAVKETDLLGAELQKHWLSILDTASKAGTVYGIGTLVVMGRYDSNCWGTDVATFYSMDTDNKAERGSGGSTKAAWTMEPICAGYALAGTIQIELQSTESGKLELVGTRFVGE